MKLIDNVVTHQYGQKDKLPIVFIHGFPFDNRMWINQIKALELNYHIAVYDIRGLGESAPGDGQFTMEMFVDDLFRIIEELGLDRPVICGMSMGGYIALRAVERDQSKFRGLILCDTKSEADSNEAKLKRAAGVKKINAEEGTRGFLTDFMPGLFSDVSMNEDDLREVYEVVLERSLLSDPKGIKGCLIAMAGRTDTTGFLDKIEIPTLLICGSLDKVVTPETMRAMSEKIKNAEFAIAPRAGHVVPLENPEFVDDVISGFIKRRVEVSAGS